MPESRSDIYEGCTVVVQKGSYLKTCRIIPQRSYTFGKRGDGQFTLNLDGSIGCFFGSSFRMEKVSKKFFTLNKIEDVNTSLDIVKEAGIDNRDLQDDGQSQKLTPEQIIDLKHQGLSGKEVIQKITENSSTFKEKTVYSQEKYINKKQKKYGEVITIHKPSIRLLNTMYYTQDPLKIANLRIDSLSQILCYCNVQAGGRFAVFESGTQGLVTAAMLHAMGTTGHLVQVYYGNHPQREAVDLMNFTTQELEVLSFINHRKLPEITQDENTTENKLNGTQEKMEVDCSTENDVNEKDGCVKDDNNDEQHQTQDKQHQFKRPRKFVRTQVEDVRMSSDILSNGVDGLVISCRQYPNDITKELLRYLNPGLPFVVFSPYKEPLMELFAEVKFVGGTNLRLCETWLRHYQVLPQRTHPEINMSGGGGYLLIGTRVN